MAGAAGVRGGGAIGVGLPDLVQVLVGVQRQSEAVADRLGGLLRAPVRAREDRLDALAAQALPQPARLLPASLGEAVAAVGQRLHLAVGEVVRRLPVAREVDDHFTRSRRKSSWTRDSPAISGWKEITSMFSWRAATGCPSTAARTSTASPYSASHGARMKTARTAPPMPGSPRSSST